MIAKSFQIGGHTIKVIQKDHIIPEEDGDLGNASIDEEIIEIATKDKKKDLPKGTIEHAYCHEIVHIILMMMNEEELNNNEKFVDNFGGFLHQILKTSKYK